MKFLKVQKTTFSILKMSKWPSQKVKLYPKICVLDYLNTFQAERRTQTQCQDNFQTNANKL